MSRVRQEANSQKEAALQKAQAKQFSSLSGDAVNIYRLMIKEIRSILADRIMLALVVYAFSFAVYAVATGASTEVTNLPSDR
jgi:ABC-2 type transport system permease protein